ncbi:MAG: FG-GAP-like repeat-containing protein [Pirellulales bacterium]|nr:FG-GAP-like repeat-containing protein [Pirellulales bacterium]
MARFPRPYWNLFLPAGGAGGSIFGRKKVSGRNGSRSFQFSCGRQLRLEPLERRDLLTTFTDTGLNFGSAYSTAWGDYNQDGWVDMFTSYNDGSGDLNGAVVRNSEGSFVVQQVLNSGPGIWGDFDNDGYLDIFAYDQHKLFRHNSETGFFMDASSMLPTIPILSTPGATWGDFNGDSYLDLYLAGFETPNYERDLILINNQGASFSTWWTEPAGARPGRGVAAADFDQDHDLDIYVSNYRLEPNYLWRNDGSGNFSDAAASTHPTARNTDPGWAGGHSIGAAWGDFDDDGLLDIFAGNFSHAGQPESRFLRNRGPDEDYRFDDMGQSGIAWQEGYSGPAAADYDNDGDLDLFFQTARGYGDQPRLHSNQGNWNFSNVTYSAGLAGVEASFQNSWADYDNDGDLDLATGSRLYRNNETGNNWLKVRLVGDGVTVNTTAIGAQVRASVSGTTITRQIEGGTGVGSQNDLTMHFGLGSFSGSVPLEITWPDGTVEEVIAESNATAEFTYGGFQPPEETGVLPIGEVGNVANLTHQPQTILLSRTFQNPVVFAQSSSANESQAAVVRVSDIESNRFTMKLAESSAGNGTHAAETVTYVVLEAGTHLLFDGTRIDVGLVDTAASVSNQFTNTWEVVNFGATFDGVPAVLSQVQTANGADYLQTRYLSTSSSSVILALEQEESATTPSVQETVGYFAIEPGLGFWNGMKYKAGITDNSVTNVPYDLQYGSAFSELPNLLGSLATYDSSDPAHVRYLNPTTGGVQLKIEEDLSLDGETVHPTEAVSYLAIGGEGTLTAVAPLGEIGEVGRLTSVNHVAQTVNLNRTYANPVVFVQSASSFDPQPAVPRVTDVQSDRFTIYVAEPSNQPASHASETVTYLVLEAGRHELGGGVLLEVGKVDTSKTVGKRLSSQWQSVGFNTAFEATPVVLSQIQTTNGDPYLKTRYLYTSSSSVILGLEPQESVTTQGVLETVGYLAIEAGEGTWNGMSYDAGQITGTVTDQWSQFFYPSPFGSTPSLLTNLASSSSSDNAHVRYRNASGTVVQLKVEEDTSFDGETTHPAEEIAYLAVGGQGMLDAAVSIMPPRVADVLQNGGAGAHDALDTLSLLFSENVTVVAEDLMLTFGGADVNLSGVVFDYDSSAGRATWNFTNLAPLAPGSYTATLNAGSVVDLSGTPLDGNADGTEGDNFVRSITVAPPGDANADLVVDDADFAIWNTHKFTSTGAWSQADFNKDGFTDVRDLNIWNAHKSFSGASSTASSSSLLAETRSTASAPPTTEPAVAQLHLAAQHQPSAELALATLVPPGWLASHTAFTGGLPGVELTTEITPQSRTDLLLLFSLAEEADPVLDLYHPEGGESEIALASGDRTVALEVDAAMAELDLSRAKPLL